MTWHLLDTAAALARLGSDQIVGLTSQEAVRRLSEKGPNELQQNGGMAPWLILWEQFTSTMALLLGGAALLAMAVGSYRDAAAIMAIVCLFALLGFIQEYRTEKALQALKRLAVPTVRVRRDGIVIEIAATDLVPGDIVLLEAGNLIPADCRLVEVSNLRVQEAALTGEAEAVEKFCQLLTVPDLPLADRRNMVYMGTMLAYGRGVGVVTATGMGTELGQIARLMQTVRQEWTPLQKRLDRLGKALAVAAVVFAMLFFVTGLLLGGEMRLLLLTAVSLAVAVIPEGLPAVVTITLAIGAQRMLKRHALIRTLPAVETLGSVTVICSDKTGTLTTNSMTVTDVITAVELAGGMDVGHSRDALLAANALCNDAVLNRDGGCAVGEPTEMALLSAAAQRDLYRDQLEDTFPRLNEIPFDSGVKRMITVHGLPGTGHGLPVFFNWLGSCSNLLIVKGAAETVLPQCIYFCSSDGCLIPIDEKLRKSITDLVEVLSSTGKRVLLTACRSLSGGDSSDAENAVEQLVLLGIVAMMDPPREEAFAAVGLCRQAGIRPVMITGDHPGTATAIAAKLDIGGKEDVLTGADLDRIGPDGLKDIIDRVSVFARVTPEHKLQIVEALQRNGHVTAMTGDGVNDAPALKKADIGVAMGLSGTDVARESADMVLLDDNFATIVAAVGEGRTIYDNIRRFIEFSVAGNLGKIMAVLVLPFLGLPMPLTPLQLLWLNLLTDGLLGLGMGMEHSEPDVMKRPPVSPKAQIFDHRMLRHTLLTGGIIGITTIWLARHYWLRHPDGSWQTILFCSLAMAQVGQAMALRSFGHSFLRMGLFTNPLLLTMVATVVVLQVSVVYLPVLQPVFRTVMLSPSSTAWVLLPGIAVFGILELEKMITWRGKQVY